MNIIFLPNDTIDVTISIVINLNFHNKTKFDRLGFEFFDSKNLITNGSEEINLGYYRFAEI
jgi:hypothetical protein